MHGFNWFDRRGTEGVGFVRALRTLLTNNLPQILPDLSAIIRSRFVDLHSEHRGVDGEPRNFLSFNPADIYVLIALVGVTHSPVYPMIVNLVVLSNAVSFFGKDLGMN